MADLFISYDLGKPVGERLAPEVVEEIQEVAPSAVVNNSITSAKLADGAVTTPKLADGSVTHPKIAVGAVDTVNIADGAVGSAQLAINSVNVQNLGKGIVTATDVNGAYIDNQIRYLTANEYAAIVTKDPNVTYAILG